MIIPSPGTAALEHPGVEMFCNGRRLRLKNICVAPGQLLPSWHLDIDNDVFYPHKWERKILKQRLSFFALPGAKHASDMIREQFVVALSLFRQPHFHFLDSNSQALDLHRMHRFQVQYIFLPIPMHWGKYDNDQLTGRLTLKAIDLEGGSTTSRFATQLWDISDTCIFKFPGFPGFPGKIFILWECWLDFSPWDKHKQPLQSQLHWSWEVQPGRRKINTCNTICSFLPVPTNKLFQLYLMKFENQCLNFSPLSEPRSPSPSVNQASS